MSDCGRIEVITLERGGPDVFRGLFNFKVQDVYVRQHKRGYFQYLRAGFFFFVVVFLLLSHALPGNVKPPLYRNLSEELIVPS